MRGKDFSLLRDNGIDRITPAYAGKRPSFSAALYAA